MKKEKREINIRKRLLSRLMRLRKKEPQEVQISLFMSLNDQKEVMSECITRGSLGYLGRIRSWGEQVNHSASAADHASVF